MDPRLDPLTPVSLLLFGGAVTLYRGAFCGGVGGGWGVLDSLSYLRSNPVIRSDTNVHHTCTHTHTHTSVGQFGGEVKLPFVLRAHQLDAAVSGANSVGILRGALGRGVCINVYKPV